MKINKTIKIMFMGLLLLTLGSSCTDKFREYNTNPDEATDEMLVGLIRIGAFFPTMQMDVIPASDVDANEYQRAQNLVGDMHAGYMTPIGAWNYGNNATQYNLRYSRWNDVAFEVAFKKVMPAWKEIKKQGAVDYPEVFAVAQVIKVAAMHRITDIYGPLPYSQFGNGEITTPYDTQMAIYNSFFQDLNAAIVTLKDYTVKHPSSKPLANYDLVYQGDFSKWLKFANALKLRLALRMVYADETKARQYAEEAVADGVLTVNSDNALLQTGNGISVFNPLKVCWDNYNDVRMGATIESYLVGYNDARLSQYFQESTSGGYHGARLGNFIYNKSGYEPLSSPAIYANTPIQWMCAAENYFLRAEGAIRGWNMQGTAQELYEKGVTLSFEQHGATLGSYLQDDSSKPAPFVPKAGSGAVSEGASLLPTITIAWEEATSFETKLERIITQKWLAVYPDGQEAWSEFRRTGYPRVYPVLSNRNANIDTNLQVRRLPFPQSEYDNNTEEVEKAATLLDGGHDNGGAKLWWDKKVRN